MLGQRQEMSTVFFSVRDLVVHRNLVGHAKDRVVYGSCEGPVPQPGVPAQAGSSRTLGTKLAPGNFFPDEHGLHIEIEGGAGVESDQVRQLTITIANGKEVLELLEREGTKTNTKASLHLPHARADHRIPA